MLISLLAATALMGAGDPDGVISTAPRGSQSVAIGAVAPVAATLPGVSQQPVTPHGLSTPEQIDRWIGQRARTDRPFADAIDPWTEDDRKMHGEVSAAIGTGDFSAFSASVSIPVGESGRIDLGYSQSRNGYGHGYGPYDRYGYGPGGFGPGGFGATGRGYGYGYGAPYVFERGVVYPGGPFAWRGERLDDGERKPERDPARTTAEE